MKISDLMATTPVQKVADVTLNTDGGTSLWNLNYGTKQEQKLKADLLKETKHARLYIIAVDGEIYKIGCSEQAKGFKATLYSYRGCGNSGSPSDRTHGIHIFIAEQLLLGKKVEFYGYNAELSPVTITDMQGNKFTEFLSPQAKKLEEFNIKAYQDFEKNNFGKEDAFPLWNLQESNQKWPEYIKEGTFDLKHSNRSVTIESIKKRLGL